MKPRTNVTLVDILIDGFEKNEIWWGFHVRQLPMPDLDAAAAKYTELVGEATRWKGAPERSASGENAGTAAWPDLEIRRAGRGVLVCVPTPRFDWWHEAETWAGDPMGDVFDAFEADHRKRG